MDMSGVNYNNRATDKFVIIKQSYHIYELTETSIFRIDNASCALFDHSVYMREPKSSTAIISCGQYGNTVITILLKKMEKIVAKLMFKD